MEDKFNDTIPKTILNYGTRVNVDLSAFNGHAKVVVADLNQVVISLDGMPFRVFATSSFDEQIISYTLGKDIKVAKELIFQPVFEEDKLIGNYAIPPLWIKDFVNLIFLRLNHVSILDLHVIAKLPLQFIEINNIKIDKQNFQVVLRDLKLLKRLRYLMLDLSFPAELIPELIVLLPVCKIYSRCNPAEVTDFYSKLNNNLK